MGKKSKAAKAKAKTGAGDGSSGAKGGVGTGGGGAGGAIVTSSKKAQKCVRCFGTVKADKGTACPGCSLLYCWRCGKKAFGECSNGSECVRPIRRCQNCSDGRTVFRVLEEKEGVDYLQMYDGDMTMLFDAYSRFKKYIEQDDTLSIDAYCLFSCSDCSVQECYHCQHDPIPRRLLGCHSCGRTRCSPCSGKKFMELKKCPEFYELHDSFMSAITRGMPQFSQEMEKLGNRVRGNSVGAISTCPTCKVCICTACMDDKSLESFVVAMMKSSASSYQCSRCYWSAKPCTNPSCPNEVGVPTKRCGDCHIDRYCSVECQAAAYPDHIGRCKKIVAKRDAAAAADVAKSDDGEME